MGWRPLIVLLAIAVAIVVVATIVRPGFSRRERRLVERWLMCDECSAGESDSVVALRDRAVPALAEALAGPDSARRSNVRRQFEASYARIAATAAAVGDTPSVSRAAYIDHFVGNYVAVSQSRSAVALGRIATPRAVEELRIALARPASFYRNDVRRTIAQAMGVTIAINAGNSQTATVNTAVAIDPAVVVQDGSGNPVRGVAVRFRPSDGGGTVIDSAQTTDTSGRATVGAWTLGPTAGSDTLRALVPGDTAVFTATATSSGAFLSIVAGDDQHAAAGTVVPVPPAVLATDAGGNPAPGIPITFTVTLGGGAVGGGAATTGPSGIATVGSWMLGSAPGPNRLRATAPALPSVTFAALGTLPVLSVDANGLRTCSIAQGGAAYCWGSNTFGLLGDGTTIDRTTPVRVLGGLAFALLSLGGVNTCGVTTAGGAYCWGSNNAGALGDGTLTNRLTPVPVSGGLIFATVSASGGHTCGATISGGAYCWGLNVAGQLGDSSAVNRSVPVAVKGGLAFSAVSAGADYTCGITTVGTAYCWGKNSAGQLGDGSKTNRNVPTAVSGGLTFTNISTGFGHTCGVTTGGAAYCWGANLDGALGDGTWTERLVPVAVSGGLSFQSVDAARWNHSCGVTFRGAAYCWGLNAFGELGNGTVSNSLTPAPVGGGLVFTSIATGYNYTCGVTVDRAVYCWGRNQLSQLGDGSVINRTLPTRVAEP